METKIITIDLRYKKEELVERIFLSKFSQEDPLINLLAKYHNDIYSLKQEKDIIVIVFHFSTLESKEQFEMEYAQLQYTP